jgi:hypothetical protein
MQTGTKPSVDIGGWISAGWNLFTASWGTWVKMGVIVMLPIIPGIIGLIAGYVVMIKSMLPTPGMYGGYAQPPEVPFAALGMFGASYLFLIIGSFVSMYFQIGFWKAAIKTARGGTPALSDLKGNGHLYLRVLGASIVVQLFSMLLAIPTCGIGAFFVMGWYLFVIPLLIDKDLSIGEAMRQSKEMTAGQMLLYILFAFVVGILAQLGAYVCIVGVIASIPLHYLIFAVAYVKNVDAPAMTPAYPAPMAPAAGAPDGWPPPTA